MFVDYLVRRRRVRAAVAFLSMLTLSAVLCGCGGSLGIDGAGIGSGGAARGVVLGNGPGGSPTYTPLAGVYVVAEQAGGMGIIRSTYTDAYGNYRFDSLPLGTWYLGFSTQGFSSIPVGTSWIVAYSEVGSTYYVPDVYLESQAWSGDSSVVVTLVDGVTGQPVYGATVMVGPATGVSSWNGEAVLSVPVRIDPVTGQPMAERVLVSAGGYDGASVSPQYITPVAHATVYYTVFAYPYTSGVQGRLRISAYETLYQSLGLLDGVSISSDAIPSYYLDPVIDPYSGVFSVTVPAGTGSFYLFFSSPYFQQAVVGPISPPGGGGFQQLSSPVYLNPIRRDVTGYVIDSSGNGASGLPSSVVIEELGLSAVPSAGAFTFFSVPVGLQLRFSATAYNPFGAPPYYETGWVDTTVVTGGASPFYVGVINTY